MNIKIEPMLDTNDDSSRHLLYRVWFENVSLQFGCWLCQFTNDQLGSRLYSDNLSMIITKPLVHKSSLEVVILIFKGGRGFTSEEECAKYHYDNLVKYLATFEQLSREHYVKEKAKEKIKNQ